MLLQGHRIFSVLIILGCCWTASQSQAPASSVVQPAAAADKPSPQATSKPDDLPSGGTFITRANLVNVVFTVTDKHGKFVKDLKQADFKVLDNSLPPKEITGFESETNLPLRVALLIDASNSIRDKFLFEQQAAIEFLQQTLDIKKDKAFVLAFDEVWDVTQDFTSDLDKLAAGVHKIRPGGGTAMWDAVYYACRDKLMKERVTETVRRAIVLVSDGDDNQSRVLRQEAIEMAQRAGVIVYTISTNLSNIHDSGDHNLQIIADATGGRAFYPFKLQDLADDFHEIQGELRSQYSISYKPDQLVLNGQFRPILISTENKKLKVRAKKGYYASTQ
jgi:Ca-activated chloride channel homolog